MFMAGLTQMLMVLRSLTLARPISRSQLKVRCGYVIEKVFFEYRTGEASWWICLHVRRMDGGIECSARGLWLRYG